MGKALCFHGVTVTWLRVFFRMRAAIINIYCTEFVFHSRRFKTIGSYSKTAVQAKLKSVLKRHVKQYQFFG